MRRSDGIAVDGDREVFSSLRRLEPDQTEPTCCNAWGESSSAVMRRLGDENSGKNGKKDGCGGKMRRNGGRRGLRNFNSSYHRRLLVPSALPPSLITTIRHIR